VDGGTGASQSAVPTQGRPDRPHRETAKHALVSNLLEGSFVKGSAETGEANFVESPAGRFSRVAIAGTVVEKKSTDEGIEIIVADGTGEIAVRPASDSASTALQGLNKGGGALIIGKVKETRERFLLAEIARSLGVEWNEVHALRARLSRRFK